VTLVVDASALLAVLFGEPEADAFKAKLFIATSASISPVNWWEVQVHVYSRYGEAGVARAEALRESLGIALASTGAEQARTAFDAHCRYHGSPARLNLGDCFAYALAKLKRAPLLCKGNDFPATDADLA
jgi:ribonuclease VapC